MSDEKIQLMKEELGLLDMENVMEITGWGESTLEKIMASDKNFPVIKIGRKNQVRFEALKEYLNCRRDLRGDKKNL